MAKYQYKAKDMSGRIIEGIYEAPDRKNVVDMIRQKSFFLIELKEIQDRKDIKEMDLFAKVSVKDLTIFCKQFASILKAGVPLIQALNMLGEQTENPVLRNIIVKVSSDIQKGSSLSAAMGVHSKYFPPILIHMVHAGEVSGTLENSLEVMSVHFEKAYKLKQKVKSAMIYPIVVLVVAVIVVIFLMIFVVPTFTSMFESSGAELPGITKALIAISGFMRNNYIVLFVIFAIIFAAIRVYLSTESGRLTFDKFKLRMPLLGKIQTTSIAATFARTMSTLMGSGVGITEAIRITGKILDNTHAIEQMEKIERQVREGKGLYGPVKDTALFPAMIVNMIMLGEESGTLEDMLGKTALFYEEEVDEATQRLTSMLEPLIIIILAVVVAFIVISIALPMFDMSSLVK
ncbi:MAG: type II secretion system F family protein [Bacillota bacterium]|jgi:type IV pilus assembly protein PilC|nr:type II secretion system F family protein [Bacillota bacterium]